MKHIISHIEYLVSRHDCVIIPNFGAILARYESACIDADTGVAYPPRRVYSFNGSLKNNDGLLAGSIARRMQIPYPSACRLMEQDVTSLMRQLREYRRMPLGMTGVVSFDASDETVDFTPFAHDLLSAQTLWLEPVPATPVNISDQDSVIDAPIEKKHNWTAKRILRTVASLALLIGVCFAASTPVRIDDAMKASLSPEIERIPADQVLPPTSSETPTITTSATGNNADEATESANPAPARHAATPVPAAKAAAPAVAAESAPIAAPVGKYYVIVASVYSLGEAQRYISMHPGKHMGVLTNDGRIRVFLSAHSSKADAFRACNQAAASYPGAWIYTSK